MFWFFFLIIIITFYGRPQTTRVCVMATIYVGNLTRECFIAKKHSTIILRKMLLKCFFGSKTLNTTMELCRRARGVLPSVFTFIRTVDQNTQNPRIRFPVGTQKFGECILSTSQAGLRRRARVHWRTDQPSYRDKGPTGL